MRFAKPEVLGIAAGGLIAFAYAFAEHRELSAQQAEPCPECRAELVSQIDLIGEFECPHGPEYDIADCGPGPNHPCCELTPEGCPANAANPGNGVCSCFSCGHDVASCEEYIKIWTVWCGKGSGGVCNNASKDGPNGVVYWAQPMMISRTPLACNPTSGLITVPYCGGGSAYLSCKAPKNVCVPFGDPQEFYGNQKQCDNGG